MGAENCNTNHGFTGLSSFSTAVSIILFILTFTLNLAIIIVFYRNKKFLKRSIFYKMLLNITVADLLTSLFSDVTSISFHVKEALNVNVSKAEAKLLHCSLFFINGVSILTMSLLCIDRIVALLKPLRYRNGVKNWKSLLMIASTWLLSAILIIPYFFLGYIKYLAIFSYVTVVFACTSLLVAAIVYKKKFVTTKSTTCPNTKSSSAGNNNEKITGKKSDSKTELNVDDVTTDNFVNDQEKSEVTFKLNDENKKPVNLKRVKTGKESKSNRSSSEKRVNKSFIIMLLVFVVTYLPACIMTAYMNLCTECNCTFIHSCRDLTYLFILSSAVFRPLNFILRLKTLRKEICRLFGKDVNRWSESNSKSETSASRYKVK